MLFLEMPTSLPKKSFVGSISESNQFEQAEIEEYINFHS